MTDILDIEGTVKAWRASAAALVEPAAPASELAANSPLALDATAAFLRWLLTCEATGPESGDVAIAAGMLVGRCLAIALAHFTPAEVRPGVGDFMISEAAGQLQAIFDAPPETDEEVYLAPAMRRVHDA